MNAERYWSEVDADKRHRVAELAGTTYNYLFHIAKGRRRPSVELAKKLEAATRQVTPRKVMRWEELLNA